MTDLSYLTDAGCVAAGCTDPDYADRGRHAPNCTQADIDLALDEVRRLRAERHELASALVTAAQHERSRLATADHRRDLADGWLDLARRSLPAPPTSDEMIGIFQRADQEDDR